MSLSAAGLSLINSAPVALPHVNFRRHGNHSHEDEHTELKFHCAHRNPDSLTTSERSQPIPKCPATDKLTSSCAGPDVQTLIFTDKEECVDLCNSLYDGTYIKEALKCFEEGCTDWRTHEGHNKEAEEAVVEEMKVKCKGVKGFTPKSNGTTADKEGEDEAPVKDEDSAASGLGVKNGALVFALVFGSVFFGLLT